MSHKRYWRDVSSIAARIQDGITTDEEKDLAGEVEEKIMMLPEKRFPKAKFTEIFRRVSNACYSIGPKGIKKGSYLRAKLIEFLKKFSEIHGKPSDAEEVIKTLVERNNGWSHG